MEGQDVTSVYKQVRDDPCTSANKRKILAAANSLLSQWDYMDRSEAQEQMNMLTAVAHFPNARACGQELLRGIYKAYERNGVDIN